MTFCSSAIAFVCLFSTLCSYVAAVFCILAFLQVEKNRGSCAQKRYVSRTLQRNKNNDDSGRSTHQDQSSHAIDFLAPLCCFQDLIGAGEKRDIEEQVRHLAQDPQVRRWVGISSLGSFSGDQDSIKLALRLERDVPFAVQYGLEEERRASGRKGRV